MSDVEAKLHDHEQRLEQGSEGRVLDAELVDGRVEVHVELDDGDDVWADLNVAVGGQEGGIVRVPKAGETVEVDLIGGDRNRARVVGWAPTSEGAPLPGDLEAGETYVVAPDGEPVVIRTSDGEEVVRVQPDGEVRLEASKIVADSNDIRLGGDQPPDWAALDSKVRSTVNSVINTLNSLIGKWNAHDHQYTLPLIPISPSNTSPPRNAPQTTQTPTTDRDYKSSKVRSG